ncbi:MAG: NAD-dependent epimerase/dehydratase family protein, partial [Deltaproteobacteria bacterium]
SVCFAGVVVDFLSSGKIENLNPKAAFYKIDIRDKGISSIFEKERPDIVSHHAAQMDVRRSVSDPVFDADVNILGMLNLLQNSVQYGVKKFIFASSGGAIYGEQDAFPAPETHPANPLSPYGISKLSGEKYLFYYKEVHGLDYVALRYANVYGPRQNPHGEAGVVAIFTTKLLKGEQPVINGDGRQTRDYVYVKDVVEANWRATVKNFCGPVNIGTGVETDVNKLLMKLTELTNSDAKEVHGQTKAGKQKRSVIDNSKAGEVLAWKPKIVLEDGLRETVEFFKK